MASGDFSIGSKVWPGLGKLMEEAGEVAQVCGKLIASRGEPEHWDGTNLHGRLEEELADLRAAIAFVTAQNGLDALDIERRCADKLALFNKWQKDEENIP